MPVQSTAYTHIYSQEAAGSHILDAVPRCIYIYIATANRLNLAILSTSSILQQLKGNNTLRGRKPNLNLLFSESFITTQTPYLESNNCPIPRNKLPGISKPSANFSPWTSHHHQITKLYLTYFLLYLF